MFPGRPARVRPALFRGEQGLTRWAWVRRGHGSVGGAAGAGCCMPVQVRPGPPALPTFPPGRSARGPPGVPGRRRRQPPPGAPATAGQVRHARLVSPRPNRTRTSTLRGSDQPSREAWTPARVFPPRKRPRLAPPRILPRSVDVSVRRHCPAGALTPSPTTRQPDRPARPTTRPPHHPTATRPPDSRTNQARPTTRPANHPGHEATPVTRPPRSRGHPGQEATPVTRPPRSRGHPGHEATPPAGHPERPTDSPQAAGPPPRTPARSPPRAELSDPARSLPPTPLDSSE